MSDNLHTIKDVRPVIQQLLNDFELAVHLIDKARTGTLTEFNYELALQLVSDVREQIHHLNVVVPEQCGLVISVIDNSADRRQTIASFQDGIPILLDETSGGVH